MIRKLSPRDYKTFFHAEYNFFSANNYENANNSWHFHILLAEKFRAQLRLAGKKCIVSSLKFIRNLLAGQKISCSADVSMKKKFYNFGTRKCTIGHVRPANTQAYQNLHYITKIRLFKYIENFTSKN